MIVIEGQKIYLKAMGAEGTMNDLYVKATDGSAATFTYEEYDVSDTTTPTSSSATAGTEYYRDVNGTYDKYVVITVVTAGEISITVSM